MNKLFMKPFLVSLFTVLPLSSIFSTFRGITDYMGYVYNSVRIEEIKEEEDKECVKNFEEKRKAYIEEEAKRQKMAIKANNQGSSSAVAYNLPTEGLTKRGGVNYYGDQKETYYNLNMNGVVNNAQNAGIEGNYWVRDDGVKMYGDYVIVAANQDVHPYGSTVDTSLGTGIVLDTGGFAAGNPTQVDIATDW